MKFYFSPILFLFFFIKPDTKSSSYNELNHSKKFYAFAVAFSTTDSKAYVSQIKTCTFEDDQKTSDIGVTFKSFASEWRDEVVKRNKLKSFYNTKFIGWYKTLNEAEKARKYQISFHRNRLRYTVIDRYQFSFSPSCK